MNNNPNMFMSKKGFTLIELLVVVAIIGILASVALASLSGARNKAKTASAQATFSSLKAEQEKLRRVNGSLPPNICTTAGSQGVLDLFNKARTTLGYSTAAAPSSTVAVTDGSNFCVSGTYDFVAAMDIDSTTGVSILCVDSAGYSGIAATPANITATKCGQ